MQKIYHLTLIFILLVIATGCDREEQYRVLVNPIYRCEPNDTILTAEEHDFTISMMRPDNGIKPSDEWIFYNMGIWNSNEHHDLEDDVLDFDFNKGGWEKNPTSISYEWIRFEKISDPGNPGFHVIVQENTSDKPRGVMVVFGDAEKATPSTGSFIVKQRPQPEKSDRNVSGDTRIAPGVNRK